MDPNVNSNVKRILPAASIVVLLVIVGVLYGTSHRQTAMVTPAPTVTNMMSPSDNGMMATASANEASLSATMSATTSATTGKVENITVTGQNYSFTPKSLIVKKGDTIKITFKNNGGIHDFVIDEFNVATKKVPSGGADNVQFVANKTGTFPYYCSVANHRAMGMIGTLTVQ